MPRTYDLNPSDIALYQRSVEYLSRLNALDPYSREYRDVYNDFLDTIDQISNRDFKASLRPTVAEFTPLVRPQVQRVQAQPQTPSRKEKLNKAQDILNNSSQLREEIFGTPLDRAQNILNNNLQLREEIFGTPPRTTELNKAQNTLNNSPQLREEIFGISPKTANLNKAQDALNNSSQLKEEIFGTPSRNIQQPEQLSPLDAFERRLLLGEFDSIIPNRAEKAPLNASLSSTAPANILQDQVIESPYPNEPDPIQEAVVSNLVKNNSVDLKQRKELDTADRFQDDIFEAVYPTPKENLQDRIVNSMVNAPSSQTKEVPPDIPESLNDRIFDAIYSSTSNQVPQESIKPVITNNLQIPQYNYFSEPLLGNLPYPYQLAILSALASQNVPSQKESQEKSSISLSDFPTATPQITLPKWYYSSSDALTAPPRIIYPKWYY